MTRDARHGLILVGILFAWLLAVGSLVGPASSTETRYAEMGREMQVSGDWVIPMLDGAPLLEKPPFVYWANAAAYAVLGVSDLTARVPSVLAGLLVLLVVAFGAKRLSRDVAPTVEGPSTAGAAAAVVLGTMPAFLAQAYTISTDIWLVLMTTLAGLAWLESERTSGKPGLRWTLLLHAAFGVGMLVKGPLTIGLVLGPALVTAAIRRRASPLKPFVHPLGLLLFAAIAVPWYLVADARIPGLLKAFVDRRLLGGIGSSADFHPNPVWVVWLPLIGAFPWLALLPSSIMTLRKRGQWRDGPGLPLLLLALAAPLLFTVSRSRLVSYASPAFPWLALLVVLGRPRVEEEGTRPALLGARMLADAARGVAVTAAAALTWAVMNAKVSAPWAVAAGAVALVTLAIAFAPKSVATLASPARRAALSVAGLLVVAGFVLAADPLLVSAPKPLWTALDARRRPGEEVAAAMPYNGIWGLLPWYERANVLFFDYPTRPMLVDPVPYQPDLYLPKEKLLPWFRADARRWLLLRTKDREKYLADTPAYLVAIGASYEIVTNLPLDAGASR